MATTKPTIVITGANGFIGRQLVDRFAALGWKVVGLVRSPAGQPPQAGVSYLPYQMPQAPPAAAFKTADYLVHAAYIKQTGGGPDAFTANLEGTTRLLAAARGGGIKKALFLSSTSAQPDAVSSYGRYKYAAERLFDGRRDAVIRAGLVIGNGGLLQQTVRFMASKHVVPLIDGGGQPLQTVAVSDLMEVVQRILTADLAGSFTVAHPDPQTYRSVYRAIAHSRSLRVVFIPLPSAVLQAIVRTIHALHLPLDVTEDNLLGLKRLRYVDTTPDLKKLGVTLEPLEAALRQAG